MTCLLEWPTSLPLESLADLPPLIEWPVDLSFSPKLQTLYYLFKFHADIWTSSSPVYFSANGWLLELTYFRVFFLVICWSYLQMEKSVTLSIGNWLYSRHHILYFSFLWKPPCWCYLVTALNLLSSSSPAKLAYYIFIYP